MPWHNLRKITKQDLLEFVQQSGDKIYALPFIKIIENFEYLKQMIYVGLGAPNVSPEQSVALYFDTHNKAIYVWSNYTWTLIGKYTPHQSGQIYVGEGQPGVIPEQQIAIYFDILNKRIYLWFNNTWTLITEGSSGGGGSGSVVLDFASDNVINLTNVSADYFLHRGEVAIIQAHDVYGKPLRIATQNETVYNMWIIPYNTGGTSGAISAPIYLNPNNTTYSNAFVYAEFWRASDASSSSYVTYPAFRIGWAWSHIFCIISNFTVNKSIIGIYNVYGNPTGHPHLIIFATSWRNTTTDWTSLGTIVWPQSSRAYILVQRVL